jgi:protein tyrosine phosphatase
VSADSLKKLFATVGLNIQCDAAFAKESFSQHGIVPYNLQRVQEKLTDAFRKKDVTKILRLSAEIGHYIGDAHVPLHTTENYNGQLTNQNGIHGFWESRIPELYADDEYDFFVGKAEYMERPDKQYWDIVLKSHEYVDSVLIIEKDLSKIFPTDRQFCFEERLGKTIRTQCSEYTRAYSERLAGMVEARMRNSILTVGSAWQTAWVDAGQPDLSKLMEETAVTKTAEDEALEKASQSGQMIGRSEN